MTLFSPNFLFNFRLNSDYGCYFRYKVSYDFRAHTLVTVHDADLLIVCHLRLQTKHFSTEGYEKILQLITSFLSLYSKGRAKREPIVEETLLSFGT